MFRKSSTEEAGRRDKRLTPGFIDADGVELVVIGDVDVDVDGRVNAAAVAADV